MVVWRSLFVLFCFFVAAICCLLFGCEMRYDILRSIVIRGCCSFFFFVFIRLVFLVRFEMLCDQTQWLLLLYKCDCCLVLCVLVLFVAFLLLPRSGLVAWRCVTYSSSFLLGQEILRDSTVWVVSMYVRNQYSAYVKRSTVPYLSQINTRYVLRYSSTITSYLQCSQRTPQRSTF